MRMNFRRNVHSPKKRSPKCPRTHNKCMFYTVGKGRVNDMTFPLYLLNAQTMQFYRKRHNA